LDVADSSDDKLIPTLRWLLTDATGTIGEVAHELESRAAEIDDSARAQLRDDVLVLDALQEQREDDCWNWSRGAPRSVRHDGQP
jgi:hypothetical protein